MLANVLRNRAASALTASCRVRVPLHRFASSSLFVRAALRQQVQLLPATRQLSVSSVVCQYYNDSGDAPAPRERRVREKAPPGRTLFVGNLPFSIEESEVREIFEGFGAISNIRIAYTPDGTARGFAHVEFTNKEDAIAAYEASVQEPAFLLDRRLRIDYAPSRADATAQPYHKLYFSAFTGDENALRQAISKFENNVIHVHFLRSPETGEPTGCGFLEFVDVPHATEALEQLNGVETAEGIVFKLAYARPPKKRADGGGSRRNSGYSENRNHSEGGRGGGGYGGRRSEGSGGGRGYGGRGGGGGDGGYGRRNARAEDGY